MIVIAFAALAATVALQLVLILLMGRLILAMLKKQGLVDANAALIPTFRPRKDGRTPVSSVPENLDLTNAAKLPIGLDGSA